VAAMQSDRALEIALFERLLGDRQAADVGLTCSLRRGSCLVVKLYERPLYEWEARGGILYLKHLANAETIMTAATVDKAVEVTIAAAEPSFAP
jgi:hypothetical protein